MSDNELSMSYQRKFLFVAFLKVQTISFLDLQVRLQNPSTKPLVYQVLLAGKDSGDFRLPMGETIQVSLNLLWMQFGDNLSTTVNNFTIL